MASRYPIYKKYDYCLSPVRVNTSKGFSYVPCGRCDGCLVHKANTWCQRLSQEIDNNSHTLFFTLTYSNKYLPYLVKCSSIEKGYFIDYDGKKLPKYGKTFWISYHGANIRYDGKKDVPRKDKICLLDFHYSSVPVTNLDGDIIPYVSKRDIQLFQKIVRKNLENVTTTNTFRSFCCSEYGETRFRPHYHILYFCNDEALAKELQSHILYESWKMCDKDRFFEYCTFADSGASSYVSQYLTCNSLLPQVYQTCKELKPFRLSSKNPAIGYSKMVESAFEKVQQGVVEYDRVIDRVDKRYIFRYSSDFIASLFPKCSRFGYRDFNGLLSLYGFLFNVAEQYNKIEGRAYRDFSDVLRTFLPPQDWRATQKAASVCKKYGWSSFHYVYCLDLVYYKMSMFALRTQYESMQDRPLSLDWLGVYTNLKDLISDVNSGSASPQMIKALDLFLVPFGVSFSDISEDYTLEEFIPAPYSDNYINELHTILEDMIKLPKFNELAGTAPQCSIV